MSDFRLPRAETYPSAPTHQTKGAATKATPLPFPQLPDLSEPISQPDPCGLMAIVRFREPGVRKMVQVDLPRQVVGEIVADGGTDMESEVRPKASGVGRVLQLLGIVHRTS